MAERAQGANLLCALLALCLCVVAAAGAAADSVRIAVVSDLNGSYGSTAYAPRVNAAVERIIELRPDVVISTGDMVAGQRRKPQLSEPELRAMWAAFHTTVSRPLARAGIPFAITPGNHDASAYDDFALERRVYAEEWHAQPPLPGMVDGSNFPFSYAFRIGRVLFVSLDATTVGALDPAQMKWLDGVLSQSEQTDAARVLFSHLPLWPFAHGRETETIGDSALEALFLRHAVSLHLSGHHHAYYPGSKDGIAYVSQACLGSGARRLLGEAAVSEHAFTMIEISEDGGMTVEAYAAPDFRRRIDPSALPPRIVSARGVLTRLDLARDARAVGTGGE